MAQDLAGLHPAFEDLGEEDKKTFARKLRTNAAEFQVLADLDSEAIDRLRDRVPNKTPLLRVPYFSRDIHSLAGLDYVRRALFVEEKTGAFDA